MNEDIVRKGNNKTDLKAKEQGQEQEQEQEQEQYFELSDYFRKLSVLLLLSKAVIKVIFPQEWDIAFPPTYEDVQSFLDGLEQENSDNFTESTEDVYDKELSLFFKGSLEDAIKRLQQVQINSEDAFDEYIEACIQMNTIYACIAQYPEIFLSQNRRNISILDRVIVANVHELIGYWTAKMEERKSKAKGAWTANIKRKDKNVQNLKSILSEFGGLSGIKDKKYRQALRQRAAKELGVSERAILGYLQEIRGEKRTKKT